MALPSSLNPILSIHLPIILSSPPTTPTTPPPSSLLVSPPTSPDVSAEAGSITQANHLRFGGGAQQQSLHAGIEALRLSLLGVASMHQAYLFAKSGPENRQKAAEMWNLAGTLRIMASKYLGVAVASLEGCRSDAALGACVSIALIDVSFSLLVPLDRFSDPCRFPSANQIFSGGYNYTSNMELAKTLVQLRGGPAAIVRYSPASVQGEASSPTFLGPNHFVEAGSGSPPSPTSGTVKTKKGALISSARLLLEYLTVYETFSKQFHYTFLC